MWLPLLLGLGSGLCWGAADFLGGLQSRRLPALAVALWTQLIGGLVLAAVVVLSGQTTTPAAVGWGVAAGFFGGLGLVCFYRGLAIGQMSVVAPVAACGAAVPVVVAFILGRPPSLVALGGIAAALAGVVLVSLPSRAADDEGIDPRAGLPVAVAAAVSFGLFFVFLDRGAAAGGPPLWVVAGARAGSLTLLILIALAARRPLGRPGRRRLAPFALVGVVDTTANVLFTYAAASGNLGVVSVLGSLYPVATVLLARLVLAERLGRPQGAGVAVALTGVALMATG
jgi:drug/metabolite transporter (DMT)-like permease